MQHERMTMLAARISGLLLAASLAAPVEAQVTEPVWWVALELPATEARVLRYPFALTAKSVGRFTLGIVALAAFLEETGLFPTEALADAINASQEPKTADSSLKALAAGKALVG